MCLADLYSVREPLPALLTFPMTSNDCCPSTGERAGVQDVMAFRLRDWRRDQYAEPPLFLCSAEVLASERGVWPVRAEHREYCRVLRGRVRIEDRHGRSWEFSAGQSFMLLRGFAGAIRAIDPVQMVRVILALPDQTALDWCTALKARTGLGQATVETDSGSHADAGVADEHKAK
jgi:hypothetical protein